LGAAVGHWAAQQDLAALLQQWQDCADWLSGKDPSGKDAKISRSLNALALLPLWLYHHESWRRRQACLGQTTAWQTIADRDQLWVMGEAIGQALHHQFQIAKLPESLYRRWLAHSDQGAPACSAQWQSLLQDWQGELVTRSAWTQLRAGFQTLDQRDQAIAIGLWGFLSAPQDFSLMLDCVAQFQPDDALSYGLAGALWGCQQGRAGLPVNLLWQFDQANQGVTLQLQTLATQLLQSWAGLADLEPAELALQLGCIAAPR
jgi:hypothetical protein